MDKTCRIGAWTIGYRPEDGGRIGFLRYGDADLLTTAPAAFRAPARDHGAYERRPVYGYDDCFPSVDACRFPGRDWRIPDHGELCWLPWETREEGRDLVFTVASRALPVVFSRTMEFRGATLTWRFRMRNLGPDPLTVLHVMHPLMPIRAWKSLELPAFRNVYDELADANLPVRTPAELAGILLGTPEGDKRMLYVQGVAGGRLRGVTRQGLAWTQTWPADVFPTLAIWWNHGAYPDEDGLRRHECAFETVPGSLGTLDKAGGGLRLDGHGTREWSVVWTLREGAAVP